MSWGGELTTNRGGRTMKTYTLKKGFGFWDTTHYPIGGCFKRAVENMPVEFSRNLGASIGTEYRIPEVKTFPSGKEYIQYRTLVAKDFTIEEKEV